AASGPRENGLDDDRPAEKRAELESDNGDHRDERVARHMTPDNILFPQTFSSCRLNIIFVHHLQYRGAGNAHQNTQHIHTERQCWKEKGRESVPDRRPVSLHDAVEKIEASLFGSRNAVGAASGCW